MTQSVVFQRKQVSRVGIFVFFLSAIAGAAASLLRADGNRIPVLVGIAVGFYFLFAIKVVDQWEKVAILRFGRFRRLQGPGVFLIIPVVDTLSLSCCSH